ncbi:kelch repeat-containing protein [Sorangium sp. So ce406]|uniref:kelch repeat-containing protein n=1 Tax=Sorangium sp. So ce406 TaxID=3133311 RepID=UPI003F5B8139
MRSCPLLSATAFLCGCSAELDSPASATLHRLFPEHAATVLSAREAFVPGAEGFLLGTAEATGRPRLSVVLPRTGSEPIRFRTPAGTEVRVREHDVLGESTVEDRAVAYRRAGGTSFWTSTDSGVEEWLLLDEGVARGDETVAAWQVEGAALRARGGAVEVVDETTGAPVLRVTAPRAYAASGRPVTVALRARGSRIELSVDAGGEAVLVDPAWDSVSMMASPRSFHTATMLPSGLVLVTGGRGYGVGMDAPLETTELYDPKADTWAAASPMNRARVAHTATLLLNGKVLVAGGAEADRFSDAELYDPTTDTWTVTAPMERVSTVHTATLLPDGKVLLVDRSQVDDSESDVQVYDPVTDAWTLLLPMPRPLFGQTATLLPNGKVLMVDGYDENYHVGTTELYDPTTDTWSPAGRMHHARSGHVATLLPSGLVLVAGGDGMQTGGATPPEGEVYDPTTDTWSPAGRLQRGRRDCTATVLPGGKVLLAGGVEVERGLPLASAELYDPTTSSWSLTTSMSVARRLHTATLLPSGEVLITGGYSGSAHASAERFGLALGEACAGPSGSGVSGCLSGSFCVDGACCDAPCPCGACSAEGHCGPVGSPAKVGTVCAEEVTCADETHSFQPARCTLASATCPAPAKVDCIAYRCDDQSGACKTSCASIEDCAPGFVCNLRGHCIRPPPAPGAVGGCSVAPGRAASSTACAVGVALVALAAARRHRRSTAAALVALAAVLAGAPVALAQPAETPSAALAAAAPATPPAAPAPPDASPDAAPPDAAPPDAADPPPADNPVAEARARFERGLDLYRQGAWEAALAEFLASRQVYPTWSATSSAALCLQQLRRYDEALALFETLLRDFSQKLPPDTRSAAQQAIVRLRGLVGTVDIAGAEIGASVMVDGHRRGDYPMPAPLRVAAGSHVVRVYKDGFEPFETRIDLAGGQVVRILSRLQKLVESGRLRVTEQKGKALDVLVDGFTVGKTPWEGALPPGQHSVVLRGPGDLGTMPASVIVRLKQTTPLALRAEELSSTLRIEPSPVCASITVDGVTLGSGVWEGRLSSGPHRVEVAAGGFVAARREVLLARGARVVVPVALERVKLGGPPGRFLVELAAAPALMPSLGGVAAGQCGGACSSGIGAGALGVVHAGYELWSGFGFGVMTGYLQVHQTVTARRTSFEIQDPLPESTGTVDDALALGGLLAGGWAGLSLGERARLSMRLGAGALLGAVSDERSGTFTSSSGLEFRIDPTAVRDATSFFVMTSEVRAGLRFGEHLELTAGLAAAVLVRLKEPVWTNPSQGVYGRIDKDRGYFGRFEQESLAGEVLVAIAPGIGARYTF